MIGQSLCIMDNKSLSINLFFTTNSHIFSEVGVKQTINSISYHNIIFGSLKDTFNVFEKVQINAFY